MKTLLAGLVLMASLASQASDCSVYVRGGLNFGKKANIKVLKAIAKKGYKVSADHKTSDFQLNRKLMNDVTISTDSCDSLDERSGDLSYVVAMVNRSDLSYHKARGYSEESIFSCAKKSKAVIEAISQLPTCEEF